MRSFVRFALVLAVLFLAALPALPTAGAADGDAEPETPASPFTIIPVGLDIVRQLDNAEELGLDLWPHTNLTLVAHYTGKGRIIGTEGEPVASVMSDDVGTNLLKPDDGFWGTPGAVEDLEISETGTAMIVTFTAPGRVAKGAKRLTLKADLSVTVAADKAESRSEAFAPAADATFTVGPITGTVTEYTTELDDWQVEQGYKASVTLRFEEQPMGSIDEISFAGDDGKALEARKWGHMFSGDTFEYQYLLKAAPAKLTVVMQLWKNPSTVKLPIAVTTGLDLR
jgi:hypothetical protein